MRPPFPEVIDSSFRAAFVSCPQKSYLEYVLHYKGKEPSVHLHAGGAFARGLEVARSCFWEKGMPAEDAIAEGGSALLQFYGDFQCPSDSAKSAERTLGAYEYYFNEAWPLGADGAEPILLPGGRRAIEFGGVEPLDITHPETGNPLLYSWRLDQAVQFKQGPNIILLGEDDKTTSQLGASWPKQWDLRSQFTGYVWGAARHGVRLDGFLVRGVSILKTKYDHMPAITYRPEWQVERWYNQLLRDVQRMIRCWEEGYWDYNLDHACTEYGGCPFRTVCLSRDPQQILDQLYARRKWDPVTRTETPL